ncbi:hypothetical protein QDZ26_000749 [Pluralibacter gergoviae]|nr:hypothetical protein [Pluralibacter gergoviae]
MDICQERSALIRIQWKNGCGGTISNMIYCTRPGDLIFDAHFWELRASGHKDDSAWDEDIFAEKMIVIKFNNKQTFRKAYGLARLMRGKFRY